jgi:flavin-dependent dehydrogenase
MKKMILLFILTIFIHLNNGEVHDYPDGTIVEQSGIYTEHYATGRTLIWYNMMDMPFDTNTEEYIRFGWKWEPQSTAYIVPRGQDGYALGIYRLQDVKEITEG